MDRFPLPSVISGKRTDGIGIVWPDTCRSCLTRECEKFAQTELQTCSYGYHYIENQSGGVFAGFLVEDASIHSPALSKNLRKDKKSRIRLQFLNNLLISISKELAEDAAAEEARFKKSINSYLDDKAFNAKFLEKFKKDIEKGLSFLHDYRQINARIAQNVNILLETRYKGNSIEELLQKANHEELAIYWASKLLEEKLSLARLLINPEWINRESEFVYFRFHGIVYKYLQMYRQSADEREIKIFTEGESRQNIYANPMAVSAIPQTFIDNAIKYSPPESRIKLQFGEDESGINFSINSFGPKIFPDEQESIFHPFTRGREAERVQEEGAGYGLYLAQLVATTHLGTRIALWQRETGDRARGYETEFSIQIPWKAEPR